MVYFWGGTNKDQAMDANIAAAGSFLRVQMSGTFALAEAKDIVIRFMQAMVDFGLQGVVVECLEISGDPTTLERYQFATFFAEEIKKGIVPRASKFAFVGEAPPLDPEHFGETVALNRGVNLRVFDNVADAQRWIGAEES